MSIKDLIANWENAVGMALNQIGDVELNDERLEGVADRRLRSDICAGRLRMSIMTVGDCCGDTLECTNGISCLYR